MTSAAPNSRRRDYSTAQTAFGPDFTGPDDSDPLETGRGLVIGVLLSSILLGGLVALAMLIWLP